jgi:hypothetical protein
MTAITQKQLDNQQAALMGVKIACELLHISGVSTDFFGEDFFEKKQVSSLFIPKIYKIVFNTLWLERAEIEEVLVSAFHETRHAYQKTSVDYGKLYDCKEKKEIIDIWNQEFKDYNNPKDGNPCNESYLQQLIEIDAIAFSHLLMLKLFTLKTVIPDNIKNLVINRMNNIQMDPLWRALEND